MTSTRPRRTIEDLFREYPDSVSKVEENTPIYQLWKSAWHSAHELFDIENDHPILRVFSVSRVKRILIRSEYVQAYEDAVLLYTDVVLGHEPRTFKTPKTLGGPLTLEEVRAKLNVADPHPATSALSRALIITGQPGIGKTLFLWYVLVRRLAIHETVAFQDDPEFFYILNEQGVTRVKFRGLRVNLVQAVLPFSTWCLVDLNLEPPRFILRLQHFLVHVAPPSAGNWYEKASKHLSHYIMKPMSLEEMEQCLSCLESTDGRGVKEVRHAYTHYGPSAWGALYSSTLTQSSRIHHALRLLEPGPLLLNIVIEGLILCMDDHPEISSRILLLTPGQERHLGHVEVITDYVYRLILDWGFKVWGSSMETIFRTSEYGSLAARSIAGGLLGRIVDHILITGHVYPLTRLSQRAGSKTWSVRDDNRHQLILPASATTFDIQLATSSHGQDHNKSVLQKRYDEELPILEDYIYYQPVLKRRASFNSFVYSRSLNQIVAFRTTVSLVRGITRSDFQFLKRLRAANCSDPPSIVLVGISPNARLGFACTNGAEDLVDEFYHLKLDKTLQKNSLLQMASRAQDKSEAGAEDSDAEMEDSDDEVEEPIEMRGIENLRYA